MSDVQTGTGPLRAIEFARRLEIACQGNPKCPTDQWRGKQKWIRDGLRSQFGISMSAQAVSRWFSGEAQPRTKVMRELARLLEVDESWLAMGLTPEFTPKEREVRSAMASGAANIFAGFIQLENGNIAYDDEDPDVDLIAILKGKHYRFEVKLAAMAADGGLKFTMSPNIHRNTVIGVIATDGFNVRFLHLTEEIIREHGELRGDFYELHVTKAGNGYKAGRFNVPEIHNILAIGGT